MAAAVGCTRTIVPARTARLLSSHESLHCRSLTLKLSRGTRLAEGRRLERPVGGRHLVCRHGFSLSRRWLPKFDLVAHRIHDPSELPVPGVVRLLQDVASLVPKRLKHSGQVLDAIVDHEGRLARREVLAISGADGPHGRSLCWTARCVGPRERCASPFLDVDSQVSLVPSSQCNRGKRHSETVWRSMD